MEEFVKKNDVLEAICEYCDSHILGCENCPIKAAIESVPVYYSDDEEKKKDGK